MTEQTAVADDDFDLPKPKAKKGGLTIEELAARLEKVEAENKKLKARAKRAPRVARAPTPAVEKPEPLPPEFEGLTEESCCDACNANGAKAVAAQRKLNEIDLRYPRRPAPDVPILNALGEKVGMRRGDTVMESDTQWLARMQPDVKEEFREAGAQVLGCCVIQGGPGCAHPRKGGLSPANRADPSAVLRFNRAARALKLDKLDRLR